MVRKGAGLTGGASTHWLARFLTCKEQLALQRGREVSVMRKCTSVGKGVDLLGPE